MNATHVILPLATLWAALVLAGWHLHTRREARRRQDRRIVERIERQARTVTDLGGQR